MKIPKEYGEKVKRCLVLQAEAQSLYWEVINWLKEYGRADGVYVDEIFLTDTPTGDLQDEDEYCDQWWGICGDDLNGYYYHQIEGSNEYVGYAYSC